MSTQNVIFGNKFLNGDGGGKKRVLYEKRE